MGCYQQQGEEGQVVAAADRPLIPEFCGAALGIPVSWGPQKGKDGDGGGEEGREGPPLPSPSALWKHVASFFLILEKSSRPTFNHIPEYTSEDHILKPERASQERKETEAGRRQGAPEAYMCLKRKTYM